MLLIKLRKKIMQVTIENVKITDIYHKIYNIDGKEIPTYIIEVFNKNFYGKNDRYVSFNMSDKDAEKFKFEISGTLAKFVGKQCDLMGTLQITKTGQQIKVNDIKLKA